MINPAPRCGRARKKPRRARPLLCRALRVKAPDGRWAPGCALHLSDGERAAYGLPARPGGVL